VSSKIKQKNTTAVAEKLVAL